MKTLGIWSKEFRWFAPVLCLVLAGGCICFDVSMLLGGAFTYEWERGAGSILVSKNSHAYHFWGWVGVTFLIGIASGYHGVLALRKSLLKKDAPVVWMKKCTCALCERGLNSKCVRWLSGSVFCQACIKDFQEQELISPTDNPKVFLLTEKGERKFPGLKVVAYCRNDSMAIYQRWVSAGIAIAGENPVCPCCLGKSAQMVKCRI